jgi:peptide/nickel transport system permease protein
VSILLAVPLGTLSAVKQDSLLDYLARVFTFAGISIPIFVTGLIWCTSWCGSLTGSRR